MSTILAAVDDTPAARAVLATTRAIQDVLNRDAYAVHVGEPSERVAAYAREFGIRLAVVPGDPAREIIAAGEQPEVGLVVLALHGLPSHRAAGHTARLLATELTKPVLVVPPEETVRAAPRKVLFPLDGTRGVSARLRPLIAEYVAAGIEVIGVHVFEPQNVPRFLDGPPDTVIWREEFVATHCADLGVQLETRPGPTVASLLEVAVTEDVDAIALAWHQDLSPEHAHVVQEILVAARRPVALIPLPPNHAVTSSPR